MERTPRAAIARALLAAAFAASVLVPAAPATAAPEPPAAERSDPATPAERTALDEARETGRQVVVPEHTTETREVLANPEGTFTLRTSAAPQRVKRDGGWTPVDTSLRANPDGTLSPAAALVDVAFSGGGTVPLISVREGAGRVSFGWPAALPAPVVDGGKATYPEVFPGVDLVVAATAVGYSHVLVVRDAEAAANPALLDLVLTAEAQGLALDVTDGVLNARDAKGALVFAGSTPVMWDGSRPDGKAPAPTATDPGAAKVTRLGLTTRKAARSQVQELRVQPDRAALAGPGVTYPVYIDPGMAGGQQAWAEVTANGYKYWNAAMDAQVGRCYDREGQCGAVTLARSYFRLDTAPLQQRNGYTAVVFSAEMWFTQVWGAHACTAESVSLYASSYFDAGITWSNQPLGTGNLSNPLDTKSSNAGTQCSGPAGVGFDAAAVKNYAQTSANNNWGSVHVALAAPNEGNDYQWKKFATSGAAAPHFDVVFSFPPGPASVHGVSNAVGCTGLAVTPDARPTLYGAASDNNSPPLNILLAFEVWDSNGVSLKATGSTSGGSGVRQGWTLPNALPDGDYAYRIATYNLFPDNSSRNLSNGNWSPWYWFRVKATAPAAAPSVKPSADYPANYWGAPKGELGAIPVDAGGATGVVGFTYTFGGSGTEPVPNTTTCDYTPAGYLANGNFAPASADGATWLPIPHGLGVGYHTMHVRSFDQAHNLSPESTPHVFYVAPNTGQAAIRYEAEDLPNSQPTGQNKPLVRQDQCCNLTWSGGKQLELAGDAAGQSFTVSFAVATEADYQVSVGMTKSADYGNAAFSLDGQPIGRGSPSAATGSAIQGYNALPINALTPLGLRRLTAGTHTLKVTVTGTHPSTVGLRYKAGLDHVTITHTTRYEAELPAQVTPSQPAGQGVPLAVEQQSATNGGPFSEGAHVLFGATAQGKSFDLAFTVSGEADYALGIALSKRPDRGKVKIAVDGIPLRRTDTEPWDGYQATGGQAVYVPLGGAHLKAGQHRLTITVVGRNAGSSGFTAGVDYLSAVAINGVTAASFTDAMNNRGFGVDGTTAANLDFSGQSLSSVALATAGLRPGAKVTHGRATFTIPTANPVTGNDNVVAVGQTIPLPAEHRVRATAIGLLAVSTCGNTQPTTATVTYTDGTTSNPVVPAVPDWAVGPGDQAAFTLTHWLGGTTPDPNRDPRVYAVFAPVDPAKTLASVTLPNTGTAFLGNTCGPVPALHVLSIAPAPLASGWLGAWAAAVDQTVDLGDPAGTTVRMVLPATEKGQQVRIKVSNTHSDVPSTIGGATVGAQSGTAAATLAAPTRLLFGGSPSVTIPAGGDVYSDPVAFPATAGGSGHLVVSLALPPATAAASGHDWEANAVAYTASGDVAGNTDGVPFAQKGSPGSGSYFLTGVEVSTTNPDHGTVAVISDRRYGYSDRYPEVSPRWTEFLAPALGDRLPGSIVQAGYPDIGEATPSGHRYALGQPSLRTVIVNLDYLGAETSLTGYREKLTRLMGAGGLRSHHRPDGSSLSVVVATIPPSGMDPTDPEEVLRKQVNELIRTSYIDLGADQFVDFDAAVRDPAAPHNPRAEYTAAPDGTWPVETFDRRLAQAVVEAVDGFPPLTL